MEDQFYQYFLEKTERFLFSSKCDDVQSTGKDEHAARIQSLMKQLRKMAISYHYNTAMTVSSGFEQDDWIQCAMITMFECVEAYDHKRPFENYVRFMVKRRLEDQRRTLYRHNPKITNEGRVDGSEPPARLFTPTSESIERSAHKETEVGGPEKASLKREAQQILIRCIQALEETQRMLFVKHEMEDISFKNLFTLLPEFGKSFATFKRWYSDEVFDKVKHCVTLQLSA